MKKRVWLSLSIIILIIISALVFKTVRNKIGAKIISGLIQSNPEINQLINDYNEKHPIDVQETENDVKPNAEQAETDESDKNQHDIHNTMKAPEKLQSLLQNYLSNKSEEKVSETEDSVPAEDKKTENTPALAGSFWDEPLVKSVYSRFSASEIAMAARASAGGLSAKEKQAVKDMVYGRVSASEIAELQRLYNLHGGK